MFHFFHTIAQKSAVMLIASVAAAFGFVAQPNTTIITPPPQILVLPAPTSSTSTDAASEVSNATSESVTPLTKNPITSAMRISAVPPQSPKTETNIKPEAPRQKPASAPVPAPEAFTAQSILDRTGFSAHQGMDGAYRLLFHTTTTADAGFDWNPGAASIGGAAQIPKFDVSFSCDPMPSVPPTDAPDQNPMFEINTSYSCAVSLADSLQRKESKEIHFQTGAGRLAITASRLDTTLKFNKSTNGFVLDNQSAAPVTVTGIAFDVSFTALNTSSPFVLRFLDPDDESILAEYPLQDLPADPASPHTHASAGIKASFSFPVKPRSQRLLMVEALGVQPLAIVGVNPEIAVTLKQAAIDRSDIQTTFFSPIISWSCVPYDASQSAQGLPTEQNCK